MTTTTDAPAPADFFGYSVAISGNVALVGNRLDDDKGTNSGSAYIFRFNGSNWTQEQKLYASDGVASDVFGSAVAIDGNTAVVRAPGHLTGTIRGMVYVFRYNGSNWIEEAKLPAPDGVDQYGLVSTVSVSGNVIVIGALAESTMGYYAGAAHVYRYNGSTWVQNPQQPKLYASDAWDGDFFGSAVAASGDVIVVGAYADDDKGNASGSAYVFDWNGSSWVQKQKLLAANGLASDLFGYAVAVSGTLVVVGAYQDDDRGINFGSVYVFRLNGSTWIQETELYGSDSRTNDQFGAAVAVSSVSGEMVVVGAYKHDLFWGDAGAAYVFRKSGATWIENAKLLATDSGYGDYFGFSVGISADRAAVGAYSFDGSAWDVGSARVFNLQTPCTSSADCNDNNPCTTDSCVSGACVNANNSAPCDDGLFCNGADTCGGGSCSVHAGNPCAGGPVCANTCNETANNCFTAANVACTADTNACTNDVCNGSGLCTHPNKPAGTACGSSTVGLCDNADTCNASGVCVANNLPNGTACADDGNDCTSDTCSNGTCAHTAKANGTVCTADTNGCTNDICSAGTCTHPLKPAGSACGSASTGLCDNADTCSATGVCQTNNLANGTSCADDGNECTSDSCSSGVCTHPAKVNGTACTPDTNGCTSDVCTSGTCTHPIKPAGSACGSSTAGLCDNADSCSASGVCQSNNLANGTACADDGIECTSDSCSGGVCTHPLKANGTPCNDGNAATSNDQCTSGTCAGTPQCLTSADCNDNNVCTNDSCVSGACQRVNNTLACTDDGNACTNDVCSGGSCTHPAKANGTACGSSANTDCTNPDTCQSGVCAANHDASGTPCTPDTNACTNDVCNGSGTCTHPNKPAGSACGSASTGLCDNPDTCSATGVCQTNTLANGTACVDDGNECTADLCNAGTCTHPALANGTPCEDGNICTDPDSCWNGACRAGVTLTCDDGDSCTIDVCGVKGCLSTPIVCPAGQTCANGVCSAGSACNNGVCDANETGCTCPGDCLTIELLCGNGVCDAYAGEDCHTCPEDCRARTIGSPDKLYCCGDESGANPDACATTACNSRGWSCVQSPPPCR